MLKVLRIVNFALIERAEINFESGFTSITGETGSGKSILLGALNLILGQRADYSVIRNPESKTIVEAEFLLNKRFQAWFTEQEIDFDTDCIIRREISANGKSRAFINDTPVQLSTLEELSERLVYIHSQHETLEIKKPTFQFDLLDAFGDSILLANEVQIAYAAFVKLKNGLKSLKENGAANLRELEFLKFQLHEIENLEAEKYDFLSFEEELNRFDKIDDIRKVYSSLNEGITGENLVLDILRNLKSHSDKWKSSDTGLAAINDRLNSVYYELEDLASEAESALEKLEMDPERMAFLKEKLDAFNNLLRKHHLNNQIELRTLHDEMLLKVSNMDASDERILELEKELLQQEQNLRELSEKLFEIRAKKAIELCKHLKAVLSDLKLDQADLRIDLLKSDLDANGGMKINMLFSANPGMELKSIDKAASGGELSRLMLAIQATMSLKKDLPTLILDEIDTGVSGEVALRIGRLLSEMGKTIQLFAITHLPQVAARGKQQLEVRKEVISGTSHTKICTLTQEERTEAIAKLMSGENITTASLENAKLLMQ